MRMLKLSIIELRSTPGCRVSVNELEIFMHHNNDSKQ